MGNRGWIITIFLKNWHLRNWMGIRAVTIKNNYTHRYKAPCIICGKCSFRRVVITLKKADRYKKHSICFSFEGDRSLVDEMNRKYAAQGKLHKIRSFEDLYPRCDKKIFLNHDVPRKAGKVLKHRDGALICAQCGKSAVGGIWISTVDAVPQIVSDKNKYAICELCLDKRIA